MSALQVFLEPVEKAGPVLVNGESLEEAINRVNADIDSLPRLSHYPLGKTPCCNLVCQFFSVVLTIVWVFPLLQYVPFAHYI